MATCGWWPATAPSRRGGSPRGAPRRATRRSARTRSGSPSRRSATTTMRHRSTCSTSAAVRLGASPSGRAVRASPRFSPDGRSILFVGSTYPGAVTQDDNRKAAADAQGAQVQRACLRQLPDPPLGPLARRAAPLAAGAAVGRRVAGTRPARRLGAAQRARLRRAARQRGRHARGDVDAGRPRAWCSRRPPTATRPRGRR